MKQAEQTRETHAETEQPQTRPASVAFSFKTAVATRTTRGSFQLHWTRADWYLELVHDSIGNINTIHIPQALISARCSGSKCSAAARPERTDSLAHARVYTNTSRAQLLLYLALATRQRQPTELDTESDVSNRTRSRGGHTHSLTQSLCTLSVSFSLCLFRVPPTV